MRYLKCILRYKGTRYFGFQRQKSTHLTIQGIVEGVFTTLLGERILIHPASRTDAGVHALEQVIHFYSKHPFSIEKLTYAANCLLPEDIRVIEIEEIGPSFHSRFSALSRRYQYLILNAKISDPLIHDYCIWIYHTLDIEKMQEAANYLIGENDFSSFMIKSDSGSSKRNLFSLKIGFMDKNVHLFPFFHEKIIVLDFWGDSFLRGMIRKITGTLIKVGLGSLEPNKFNEILMSKNNNLSGAVAAPNGLYLIKVFYET